MAIRDDSYGSVDEVVALTRRLLEGESTFNTRTVPTGTEVEKFIDRASATMNVALERAGFSTPVTNTTAKLLIDDWVVARSAEYVEMTRGGIGFTTAQGTRIVAIKELHKKAKEFVNENSLGFKRLGVGVDHKTSEGLAFTALDAQADRADPDDSDLEQPKFKRGLFDV